VRLWTGIVVQNYCWRTITSLPNSSTRMPKTSWNNLDCTSNQWMNLSFNYLVVKLAMFLFPVRCWRNLRSKRSWTLASVSRLCWENELMSPSTWIDRSNYWWCFLCSFFWFNGLWKRPRTCSAIIFSTVSLRSVDRVRKHSGSGYGFLYADYICEIVYSLTVTNCFLDDPEPYLLVVMFWLEWRFKLPSDQLELDNWKSYTTILCVVDEEIGDTFYY
jgi:hypothetical protein